MAAYFHHLMIRPEVISCDDGRKQDVILNCGTAGFPG